MDSLVRGPSAGMAHRLAVYTVVHPGVKDFVAPWYASVARQTDAEFDLWISVDSLAPAEVIELIGREPRAQWIQCHRGETPAEIRCHAIQRLVKDYSQVVFVDSDDILRESRVAAAREGLKRSDLTGCALALVDQRGQDLGEAFCLPACTGVEDVLPRNNVFGLSNSAYRSSLLGRCLPIPGRVVLVDWFLATRAWLLGARLAFDSVIRMDYRQHGANMARVRYPTSAERVTHETELVRRHFELVLGLEDGDFLPERLTRLKGVVSAVEAFYRRVVGDIERLQAYVAALNVLSPAPLWWSSVAHPALAWMWQEDRI